MATPNWVVNSKYILVLNLVFSVPSNAKDFKFQDMKYLSGQKFAKINRKANYIYVGGSYIDSSSVVNLSHFQNTILKAN